MNVQIYWRLPIPYTNWMTEHCRQTRKTNLLRTCMEFDMMITNRFLGFECTDIVQKPLQSPPLTIWIAVSSHETISPYFIEDENENQVIVNQGFYERKY